MKRAFFVFFSLCLTFTSYAGSSSPDKGQDSDSDSSVPNHGSLPRKLYCQAIRDEPDTPTYAFELLRSDQGLYEGRYLNLPGDPQSPPQVVASIADLKCRFLRNNRFYFQCEKFGASIESIRIREQKLSLISNSLRTEFWREFRAIGNEVPNVFLVFRFGSADQCSIHSP